MQPVQFYIKNNTMANVLIPTDFTANTLQLAAQALQALDVNTVNIVLFHAFKQPESEFELLAPVRPRPHANLVTEELRQLCKQFKEQHTHRVQKIYFRFLEGETTLLFRNFIDANEVDLIFCPESYVPVKVNTYSTDPRQLFKKAGVPVIREYSRQKIKTMQPTAVKTALPVIENFSLQASS